MIKAKMNKMIVVTDNSGLLPETYIIEFTEDISTYRIKRPTEEWTIEQAVDNYETIYDLIHALTSAEIKFNILRVDELTMFFNNLKED